MLLLKLAVGLVALGVLAAVLLRGVDLRAQVERTMEAVREAGPVAFFSAMAVLPAVGFPIIVFFLSAGPAFAPTWGLPAVIAACAAALACNLTFAYWLARYALRPLALKLVKRLGYQLPAVRPEDHFALTALVRLTPGPPYFLQCWLLGIAETRFPIYLGVSLSISMAYGTAALLAADSLLKGRGGMAVAGLTLLVAIVIATRLVRKRMSRRVVANPVAESAGK